MYLKLREQRDHPHPSARADCPCCQGSGWTVSPNSAGEHFEVDGCITCTSTLTTEAAIAAAARAGLDVNVGAVAGRVQSFTLLQVLDMHDQMVALALQPIKSARAQRDTVQPPPEPPPAPAPPAVPAIACTWSRPAAEHDLNTVLWRWFKAHVPTPPQLAAVDELVAQLWALLARRTARLAVPQQRVTAAVEMIAAVVPQCDQPHAQMLVTRVLDCLQLRAVDQPESGIVLEPCPSCRTPDPACRQAAGLSPADATYQVECLLCGTRGPSKPGETAARLGWNDLCAPFLDPEPFS